MNDTTDKPLAADDPDSRTLPDTAGRLLLTRRPAALTLFDDC